MSQQPSTDPHHAIHLSDSTSLTDSQIGGQAGRDLAVAQVQGTGNQVTIIAGTQPTTLTRQEYRNRQALLTKVKNFWVKGVLEKSLHDQVLISLGLEDRPEAIAPPWSLILETTNHAPTQLPQDTSVISIFDQLGEGRSLLILGDPGSGKTMTLLQLARDLVERAEQDVDHRIPVVFNLSSWVNVACRARRDTLATWLIEELNTKYQVPKPIGQSWVEQQQLLLLLDGLDEVQLDHREACVAAINTFQQNYATEMVVCSRIKDYEALSNRLAVQSAVYLRSLTLDQIHTYLTCLNTDLSGLTILLQHDQALQELAQSPLMLNIMVLAYEGVRVEDLPKTTLVEEHRHYLFNTYIQRMLSKHRSADFAYSQSQTLRWLSWLAQELIDASQTIFLIERIAQFGLKNFRKQGIYSIISSLIVSFLLALMIALPFGNQSNWLTAGLTFWLGYTLFNIPSTWLFLTLEQMPSSTAQAWLQRLHGSIWTGWASGLIFGFIAGLEVNFAVGLKVGGITILIVSLLDWFLGGYIGLSYLKPVETLKWSWVSAGKSLPGFLLGALPAGFFLGLAGVLGHTLLQGTALGLLGGLIFGLLGGLRSNTEVEARTFPNQGTWRSAQIALATTLSLIVILAIGVHLMGEALQISLSWAIFCGLFAGLLMGGSACIIHFSRRLLFWGDRSIPWNYARFLDWACDRLFLQKVGGGYIFVHRLLMEHFAGIKL